jgi:hypothetical protein
MVNTAIVFFGAVLFTAEGNATCSGPGEFCCEAPGGDVNNCPGSARTSNCDAKGSCCCGFADFLARQTVALTEENPTCSGPGEFCCEAPGGDVSNCPASARTSNCDAKGSCCCGLADVLGQTAELTLENPTCSGPGEFCCEAPGGDVNNCPGSARTSNCDAKGSCCCGFADFLARQTVALTEENPTCSGPGEFCCPAPGDDVNNCPGSARTSNCDAKKSCCCGFAEKFLV